MQYLTPAQLLSFIHGRVPYSIRIGPFFCGLEYFESFEFDALLCSAKAIPINACDLIAQFFAEELPKMKKVNNINDFKVILIRSSVEILRQIRLGYRVKVMVWYNYIKQEAIVPQKRVSLTYPVSLKIPRPTLR